ncbi:cytochrome c [Pseudomonas sp. CAU 1711]|uniref:c-type cytochrome n=1 Tax=Pseudomonas sp. CAU 1711 TaxID=3140356 RepID=UPI0032619FA8
MKRTIATLVAAGVAGSAALLAGAYVGLVNVGADDPHFPAVHAFLAMARDRSIAVRAKHIEVPRLDDEALIRAGAGNYDAMCVGCHLAPGVAQTELGQALYPAPPNLTETGVDGNPAAAFWVIKHGIKATGMPAWGKSMADEYIWGMVAFLNELPRMDVERYRALVASSAGHRHGGGESPMHNHEGPHGDEQPGHPGTGDVHHDSMAAEDHHGGAAADADAAHSAPQQAPKAAPTPHTHSDGKQHVHES